MIIGSNIEDRAADGAVPREIFGEGIGLCLIWILDKFIGPNPSGSRDGSRPSFVFKSMYGIGSRLNDLIARIAHDGILADVIFVSTALIVFRIIEGTNDIIFTRKSYGNAASWQVDLIGSSLSTGDALQCPTCYCIFGEGIASWLLCRGQESMRNVINWNIVALIIQGKCPKRTGKSEVGAILWVGFFYDIDDTVGCCFILRVGEGAIGMLGRT